MQNCNTQVERLKATDLFFFFFFFFYLRLLTPLWFCLTSTFWLKCNEEGTLSVEDDATPMYTAEMKNTILIKVLCMWQRSCCMLLYVNFMQGCYQMPTADKIPLLKKQRSLSKANYHLSG